MNVDKIYPSRYKTTISEMPFIGNSIYKGDYCQNKKGQPATLLRPDKNKTPITGGDFIGETTSGVNYVPYPGAKPEPGFHVIL